jgi:hypothetical protein
MSQSKKFGIYSLFGIAVLCIWLFVGIVDVVRMEGESHRDFFLKKIPTFKVVFFDPYRSDAMGEEDEYQRRLDNNGDWLPGTYELNEFLSYCKHRYGISGNNPINARSLCKSATSIR